MYQVLTSWRISATLPLSPPKISRALQRLYGRPQRPFGASHSKLAPLMRHVSPSTRFQGKHLTLISTACMPALALAPWKRSCRWASPSCQLHCLIWRSSPSDWLFCFCLFGPSKSQPKSRRPSASPATSSPGPQRRSPNRDKEPQPSGVLLADAYARVRRSLLIQASRCCALSGAHPRIVPQHGDGQLSLSLSLGSQTGALGRPAVSHQRRCTSGLLLFLRFVVSTS